MSDYLAFRKIYREDLLHYGIKRRSGRYPWGSGERPFQDRKIQKQIVRESTKGNRSQFREGHTIPKGTTVYRVTTSDTPSQNGSTYVTYLTPERNLYRGGNIRLREGTSKAYEHTMELKEDLKVPSREVLKDSIETAVKNNPKLVNEIAQGWLDIWMPRNSWAYIDSFWDDNLGGVNEKKAKEFVNDVAKNYKNKTIDEAFAMTVQTLGASPKLKKAIIDDLKKKGYNAMVDEAGVGTDVPEGIDPLIVFDSNKSLSYKSTSKISSREESKSRKDFLDWQRKAQTSNAKRGGVW